MQELIKAIHAVLQQLYNISISLKVVYFVLYEVKGRGNGNTFRG